MKFKNINLNRPFVHLIMVQIREFYREPASLFWSLLFPVLMAWGLGIAFSKKTELSKTIAVVMNDNQPIDSLERLVFKAKPVKQFDTAAQNYYLQISYGDSSIGITQYKLKPVSRNQAEIMVKRGNTSLIISKEGDKLLYHFDNLNSDAQLSYLQLSSLIGGVEIKQPNAEIKPMTERGTRYVDFLIPGLIAMNVMMSTMWGISYSLIEARTKKMLRRMVATPMPRWEYIMSHFVARVILCFVEASIIMSFSFYYFDITIGGSTMAFIILFISGIVAFTGISVLVACRTSKTHVGNGLINLVIMPMMLLSGIYFSYHNFPDLIIPYIQALPLTMLADGIRSIFNEGAGLLEVSRYIFFLNALGVISFFAGLKYYKWY